METEKQEWFAENSENDWINCRGCSILGTRMEVIKMTGMAQNDHLSVTLLFFKRQGGGSV